MAPRLFSRLLDDHDIAPLGTKAWGDARLPVDGRYVNVLTGERVEARDAHLRVAELLGTFPAALLVKA